jgi:hypothetical protein
VLPLDRVEALAGPPAGPRLGLREHPGSEVNDRDRAQLRSRPPGEGVRDLQRRASFVGVDVAHADRPQRFDVEVVRHGGDRTRRPVHQPVDGRAEHEPFRAARPRPAHDEQRRADGLRLLLQSARGAQAAQRPAFVRHAVRAQPRLDLLERLRAVAGQIRVGLADAVGQRLAGREREHRGAGLHGRHDQPGPGELGQQGGEVDGGRTARVRIEARKDRRAHRGHAVEAGASSASSTSWRRRSTSA